ncbi:MAG: DUF4838 domain-containing protein [Clostridia bacterium]|nr:DUF4838 domain-containing protein [Clostridia bacterium]
MLLANERIPNVPIYLSDSQFDDRESPALYAAKEMRYYLDRMTSASFRIAKKEGEAAGIYIGDAANLDVAALGDDGFRIVASDNCLRIAGGVRGVIYGVYEFLETLGCRFFTHNCEKIPTVPNLSIPDDLDITKKPVIEYREHNYADAVQNPRFSVKCRFNGASHRIPARMGGHMPYAWFVHTFERMVPPSVYGETHPEYYSLIDGKRVVRDGGRTQLCLTNPEVVDICTEAVRDALKKNPDARLISISQNDWMGNCQCENCQKIDREEGSPAGTLLRFVNTIAERLEPEFPNIIFDTLAYNYSRPAPKITRNRKNVCVRLCSIEACFSHPFETCDDESRNVVRPDGTKANFITDLRDWGNICDRMYIWDYTTCFAHYPTPHPNWRVLQPNVQAMVKNNVKGIFEQANGASRGGVDFNELRLYLISKLLWDPYCDIKKHRQEFMEYYYGDAAPALNEYLELLCDTVDEENIHVGFNDQPTHAFLREELLDRYDVLFDKAASAVAGDALRLYRVEKNRLSIRWVRLKRKTMLNGKYDPEEINRFFADWRAFNMSRIDEWCNFETTHRALLEGKWRGVEYFEHWTAEEPELF